MLMTKSQAVYLLSNHVCCQFYPYLFYDSVSTWFFCGSRNLKNHVPEWYVNDKSDALVVWF